MKRSGKSEPSQAPTTRAAERKARRAAERKYRRTRHVRILLWVLIPSIGAAAALHLSGYQLPKSWSDITSPSLPDFSLRNVVDTRPASNTPPSSSPPAVTMTNPVLDGDLRFMVTEAAHTNNPPVYGGDTSAPPVPTGGTATVSMTVDNVGSDPYPFVPTMVSLIDNHDGEFTPAAVSQVGSESAVGAALTTALNPGQRLSLVLTYLLPGGSFPTRVSANDAPYTAPVHIDLVP